MNAPQEKNIEETEALLKQPSIWLERQLMEDTKRHTEDLTPESEVAIFAVVTNPRTPIKGTVQVGNYSASDLYAFSKAPVIEFNNSICSILDELEKLKQVPEDDLEFEVQATYMWASVARLQRYLKTSPTHDEALSSLQQICFSERAQQFDRRKLSVLVQALTVLRDNVFLSTEALDKFSEILEEGGFELNAPMKFLKAQL